MQNGLIEVHLPNDSARITFFDKSSESICVQEGSHASFYGNQECVIVCISGHNKIPYIDEGIIYIQNKTINENVTYKANIIKVGSNVTPQQTSGPVVINNGKTVLKGNTVEIHGDMIVPLGAELEIRNE